MKYDDTDKINIPPLGYVQITLWLCMILIFLALFIKTILQGIHVNLCTVISPYLFSPFLKYETEWRGWLSEFQRLVEIHTIWAQQQIHKQELYIPILLQDSSVEKYSQFFFFVLTLHRHLWCAELYLRKYFALHWILDFVDSLKFLNLSKWNI